MEAVLEKYFILTSFEMLFPKISMDRDQELYSAAETLCTPFLFHKNILYNIGAEIRKILRISPRIYYQTKKKIFS